MPAMAQGEVKETILAILKRPNEFLGTRSSTVVTDDVIYIFIHNFTCWLRVESEALLKTFN